MNPLVPTFLDIVSFIVGSVITGAVVALPIALIVGWRRRRKAV
jgi:hypothetical protein